MIPPKLHDAHAAGRIVGKSASWMYQQGAAGNIPRTKIGHHVFWTDEQLAQIIRDGAQQPKPAKQEKRTTEQRRTPQPPKREVKRKRSTAPIATTANIPVADYSVSRLYREEGAA
jgi:hypothetical protein